MDETEFVQSVKAWVNLDNIIRDRIVALRELKEQRKEMEGDILEYMKVSDQEVLAMSTGGTLRRSVSKTKQSLKEDYLRDMLARFGSTPEEATSMVQAILSERPTKEREYLKRTQPRKKV